MLRFFIPLALALGVIAASPQRLWSSAFALPGVNASYDYVIIGGGTAGLAIASRLAEFASVAVIEAGGTYETDNGNLSVVPSGSLAMSFISAAEDYPRQPLIDWGLISVPQVSAGDRRIHYPRGKTLGGSSAINSLGYHRGTLGSYQRWADLVGDQNYTFPNLLQYFKKSTHLTPPNLQKRNTSSAIPQYDPTVFDNSLGGPLQVSWSNWVDPTTNALSRALQAVGLPPSPKGFNSGFLSGYGAWITATISPKHARRSSSQSSYLDQIITKTQIMVYLHTQAMKIQFNSSTPKKASSVLVSTLGLEYTIFAKKEIILSAGTFHSPQLLIVSGIGPRATLESLSIPVIYDLQGVGQNLWDPVFFLILNAVNTTSGGAIIANPQNSAETLKEYLEDAKGPHSAAGGYFAFEKLSNIHNFTQATASSLAWFPSDWPEIELGVAGFPAADFSTIGAVSATLTAPLSRGNVTITSASMKDQPSINMGWLTDPADAEVAVAAFKRCREIWNSEPAQKIKVGDEISPGAAVSTDEEILDFIRQSLLTIFHASATCAMGKTGDPNAVVDSNARVFGVDGLRVVDASAFPFAVPGHPQASVYMLAEKIADDIKNGR